MRRMKSSAASTTPTETAITMSKTTVSTKQSEQHDDVAPRRDAQRCAAKWRSSDMFQATTRGGRRAPPSARRRRAARGRRTESSTTSAWTIAAIGERAPARMLVAVRASAPVAAMPPKKGATMLPSPRPMSSASGSCRVPVMPSATTAESSDSMAPSIAIAKAAGRSSRNVASVEPPAFPRAARAAAAGVGCRHDSPVDHGAESVGRWWRRADRERACRASTAPPATAPIASSGAGNASPSARGNREQEAERWRRRRRSSVSDAFRVPSRAPPPCSGRLSGMWRPCSPSASFSCRTAITTAIPAVKPVVTGYGMNSIRRPSAREAHGDQQDAGQHPGEEQSRKAVARRDRRQDHDESGRRTRDLESRAARERDDGAGDDGRVEAVLRRHADRDRERHRERQRDDADDAAGEHVGAEGARVVASERGSHGGREGWEGADGGGWFEALLAMRHRLASVYPIRQ